jgi:hypothetical protein
MKERIGFYMIILGVVLALPIIINLFLMALGLIIISETQGLTGFISLIFGGCFVAWCANLKGLW